MADTRRLPPGTPGVVPDGNRRLILAIEADVRPEVESEFAHELDSAGCFRRWWVLHRIEQEVTRRIHERTKMISLDGLF